MEATATGHAMLALHTAEKFRFNYCEAADAEPAPSTGSRAASTGSQSNSKGSAHAGSKQSVQGRKGSDASADKDNTWQGALEHAHAAAQAWQACLHGDEVEGAGGCDSLADADLLSELMLELLFMAGLHGKTLVPTR